MTPTTANPAPCDLVTRHREVQKRAPDLAAMMRSVRSKTGKSIFAQVLEAGRLVGGVGKLSFAEYFIFQLYDDALHSPEAKRQFLSERLHWPMCAKCADPQWRATTEDKWLAYQILGQFGIRVPQTLAVCDKSYRSFGRTRKISSAAELAAFLSEAPLPLFAKPNGELGSFGAFTIDRNGDGLFRLDDGRELTSEDLFGQVIGDRTYLLQAVVQNHPAIARFARHVPTVRTINLVWPDRIETPFILLKLPVGENIADNYWRPGNMIADLDPATGEIRRVVSGKGVDTQLYDVHPETGEKLVGALLPLWRDLLAVNEACARAYAPVRYQSLDIALTPDGPCVIEVNSGGSFFLPQIASGRGFLTPEVRSFFSSCGWKFR